MHETGFGLRVRRSSAARRTLACALLWLSVGRAEPPSAPTDAAGSQAEARYRQGISEFEAGHWREAVELFKQADALAPSPWLSFNIAKIFERMRDSRSALAWYRDYVRRSLDTEPLPDVLVRVAELEDELAAQGVQQLSVLSTPPGATVLLDGASRGVTPFTGELAPGAHVLELRLRGHHDTWRELTLPSNDAIDVEVTLVALQEGEVASDASGAERPPVGANGTLGTTGLMTNDGGLASQGAPSWWTWSLFGGSAALLLGSGAVELSRRRLEHDARRASQVDYGARYDQVESRQTAARVLLGAGVLVGLAGGVSLYFDLRPRSTDGTGVALGCGNEVCGLQARRVW